MDKQLELVKQLRKRLAELNEDIVALERAKALVRCRAANNGVAAVIIMAELLRKETKS
jgi:hypothetical protein